MLLVLVVWCCEGLVGEEEEGSEEGVEGGHFWVVRMVRLMMALVRMVRLVIVLMV